MKRFWKDVGVEREGDGWAIQLDGRPVKTPARAALVVPAKSLADGIADESGDAIFGDGEDARIDGIGVGDGDFSGDRHRFGR